MNNKKEWIVSLRAFACMAVIMIHVIDGWTETANIQLTGNRFVVDEILFQPLIRWAVPVFIMISGCLLLDPKKDITIKKVINYIKRIVYILVTFVFAYCIIESILLYGISNLWKVLYMSIFNLFQGKSWAAMWYIYLLIGLYIITPLLRHFVKDASKEEMKFMISGLMIFSVVIPTINSIFNIKITTFYLEEFKYLLLYLLGYAIANNYFDEKKIFIYGAVGLIGYLFCSALNILVGDQGGMFIILISASVFCFFANKHYKIKNNKMIEIISNDSFGIYIIHIFWLNILNKGMHIYPDILPVLIGEIVFFIMILIISLISIEILKKLPFFNKIL